MEEGLPPSKSWFARMRSLKGEGRSSAVCMIHQSLDISRSPVKLFRSLIRDR